MGTLTSSGAESYDVGSQLVVCCALLTEASGGISQRESKADGDAYMNYYDDNYYWDSNYQDYSFVPNNQEPQIYSDYPDYSSVPNNPGLQISLEDYSYVPINQGPSIPSDSDYPNPVSLPVNQNTPAGPDNLANDQRPKVKSFVYFGSPAQKEKWVTNQAPVRSFTNFQVKKEKTKIKVTNQAEPKSQQDTNIGTALKTIGRNIGKTIKNILNPSRKN